MTSTGVLPRHQQRQYLPGWKHSVSAAQLHKNLPSTTDSSSSDAQIQKQMQVLNQDFAQTGISYRLGGVDRSINPNWFNIVGTGSASQTQMKQALRRGGAADLNIYTVG